MKATTLYEGKHQWTVFGRDPDKPEKIIDTNQYLVSTPSRALLIDPGGIEIFSSMLAATLHHVSVDQITDLFASHQDPDIISSLGLWDQVLPNAKLHSPWLWESFIRHFGLNHIEYVPLPDDGGTIDLGDLSLQLVPAHYLHSSGNFNIYDPQAKILFSGDVGAALEADGAPMFVDDFDEHIPKMKMFHQRWMPSNRAKNDWISRVRRLDIEILAPQHGRLYRGADVKRFLDWFETLEVGIGV
ncbi:MAG: FprA family A-type flavoprotein [Gammaproteobacteria bacterium]|nr:FprA family A-type flavoprotein [Gammaproteobacteria bacterium]MCF6231192.1 FprA family A-type flavoprotein [Gammaproteobacteria bacterium]